MFDEQRPIAPSVFFNIPHYNADNANVYLAKPLQIDYSIECFNQTAIVNMVGIWKNTASHDINCVFMLPMRGRVTDCHINIGSERVRSVGLQNRDIDRMMAGKSYEFEEEEKHANGNIVHDDDDIKEEWQLMDDLFCTQICGYFRMPFDRVKPNQLLRVDLYYTETLQFQHNAYYLRLACAFTSNSLKTNKTWNDIMSIEANIHVPPDAQHTVHSDSHTLSQTDNHDNGDRKLQFRATQAKKPQPFPRAQSADEEEEKSSLKTSDTDAHKYGRDFELQYYIISASEKFTAHLLVNDNAVEDEDYISHHLLLTPPSGVNVGDRCVCFLLDRSWRTQSIWHDMIHGIKHSLERMDDNESFAVVLFEEFYACEVWAASDTNPHGLHSPAEHNKKNVFAWLVAHKPDSRSKRHAPSKARTQQPFLKCLDILQHRQQRYPYLVVLAATYFVDDREIVRQMQQLPAQYYDEHKLLRTRIFTVSYGYAVNAYLMRYLSLCSRGKSIHITDPCSVYKELVCFFNEFRSLLCTDIAVTLESGNGNELGTASVQNDMIHPFPIADLYHNHAVVIKLRVPRRRRDEAAAAAGNGIVMSVRGVLAHNGECIEFAVCYDTLQQYSFPMNAALAQSHLDALHANIWMLHGSATCQQLEEIANAISDDTGLSSPTRLLSSQETVLQQQQQEQLQDDDSNVSKSDGEKMALSPLSLPPRTGKGRRGQNQKSLQKKKAAVMGSVIVFGAVATVTVINPFGGDDGVFGGWNDAIDTMDQCCGDTGCDSCGDCGDGACCNSDLCVVL